MTSTYSSSEISLERKATWQWCSLTGMELPSTGIYRTRKRFVRRQGLYARQGQCDSPVHRCECGVKVPLLMALHWGRHLTHESQSHDFSCDSQSRSRLWLSCRNPESDSRQRYVGRQQWSRWGLEKDIVLVCNKKNVFVFVFVLFPVRLNVPWLPCWNFSFQINLTRPSCQAQHTTA